MNDKALIAATLGFTTVEVVKLWRDASPSLEEVRAAPIGDVTMQQRLMDANYLGAGLAVLVGGTVSYLTSNWIPILLSLATVTYMSWWYRQVLVSDNDMMKGQ